MSEEKPPPPLGGRTRLPFETKELRAHPGFRAAAALYAFAAIIMGGVAAYMAFAVGHPWMSIPVMGPALGALYFVVRFAMVMRPRM